MTYADDDLLASRFESLASRLDDSDWTDVLARVGGSSGRRQRPAGRRARLALAVPFVAALVFLVAPALGIGPPALDFFAAKHAPKRVVVQFEQLGVGAPAKMNPRAIPAQARLVTTYHLRDGSPVPLWVAPTRTGGFCFLSLGGGCQTRHARIPSEPGDLDAGAINLGIAGIHGSTVLTGSVFDKRISEIEVRFRHAPPVQVPLLWVGSPVDAGFFFYELTTTQHRQGGARAVVALDAGGQVVARVASIFRPRPAWSDPRKVADLSKKHVILRSGRASIAVAPSRTGGNCFWLGERHGTISGGCAPPRYLTVPLAGGLGHGPTFTVFSAQVKPSVARVELRFQDGARIELIPVRGFVLYTIPSGHWRRGHRLTAAIAYSSGDKRLATESFDPTQIGMYPCRKPVPIGAGLTACR